MYRFSNFFVCRLKCTFSGSIIVSSVLFHADIVYVGESLRLRLPFASLGLVPEWASSYMLQANIGAQRAAELFYTADWVDAARAVALGLALEALPDDPNSHYFHAFNLGRYSQSISVVKALKQGVGGKIQKSLKRALKLQPDHAEAHTALGMYHAEIIDKVGKLIGGMTYGASEADALKHFATALELTPRSPIARIEYGNGLYLLYGDDRIDEVSELYIAASETEPLDAMERLDVESALAELE